MEEKKPEELKLEIQLDEEIAQGAYVNLTVVNHNDSEFVVDFIFVQPQSTRAKVRSRVILSPQHARQFAAALQENLRRYDQVPEVSEEVEALEKSPADDSTGPFH